MAKIAYVRVSTEEQNTASQIAMLPEDIEKVFEEKKSGKNCARPALQECLAYLRRGDELYVAVRAQHKRLAGNGRGPERPRRGVYQPQRKG